MLRNRVLLRSFSNIIKPNLEQRLEILESKFSQIEKKNITTNDLDAPIFRLQKSKESNDPTKGNYDIDFNITKGDVVAGFAFSTAFYLIFKLLPF